MMNDWQKEWMKKHTTVFVEEPMSNHTTFRIGGPAEIYALPTEKELSGVLSFALEEGIPVTVLGNGSNVLVSDEGIKGIVISIGKPMSDISVNENVITVQAGAMLAAVARTAGDMGLSGMEFAGGIPGSVGGAVVMNAGAYGGEMSDILVKVRALRHDGETVEYTREELDLGYRHSIFADEAHKNEIVISAEFRLKPGDRQAVLSGMEELNSRRREKQPLEYPSAGSTFKRPEGYFAGKLIQDSGLAGYSVGNAQVSDKHCGFVINKGRATAEDVRSVIAHVKKEVERNFGVKLEEEVRYIG